MDIAKSRNFLLSEITINNPVNIIQQIIDYLNEKEYFKGMYDVLYGWGVEDYENWDKIESYKDISKEDLKNILDGLKYEYERKNINEININKPGNQPFEILYIDEDNIAIEYNELTGNIWINEDEDDKNIHFFVEYGRYFPEEEITDEDALQQCEKMVEFLRKENIDMDVYPNDGDGGITYYSINIPIKNVKHLIKDYQKIQKFI